VDTQIPEQNQNNTGAEEKAILEIPKEPVLEEIRSEKEVIARIEGRNRRRDDEFDQKVLDVARVTRVTKGGKRFTFRATVVLGDHKNRVGVGTGRGADVAQAIEKASRLAKKNAITVLLKKGTIPHLVEAKYASARVLLKPAMPGSGVKAGGPVRIISKLAGIQDITSKLISRTSNKINIAQAVIQALRKLK